MSSMPPICGRRASNASRSIPKSSLVGRSAPRVTHATIRIAAAGCPTECMGDIQSLTPFVGPYEISIFFLSVTGLFSGKISIDYNVRSTIDDGHHSEIEELSNLNHWNATGRRGMPPSPRFKRAIKKATTFEHLYLSWSLLGCEIS
jgi:hypothetical protein